MEFANTLPNFDWAKVDNVEDGILKGNQGFEAVYFAGGESAEHLGPEGCEDMALQWQDLNTISAIKIGPNSINDVAVATLCELLTHNDAILYFSLFTNSLTKVGIKSVAEVLVYNKTLVALQLLDAKLTDECVTLLAAELEHTNRTLLQIDLSNNLFGDPGAKSLAKAIKVNDILTTIGLSANSISDKGAEALAKSLEVNFTLCLLDVSRNLQSDTTEQKIHELLKRNKETMFEAMNYCSANVKQGPLRKAKICFVGRHNTGKTALVEALKGKQFNEDYIPTEGAIVTQVLTRLRGDAWYGIARLPTSEFGYQFLSRFVNIKLDEKVEMIEKEAPAKKIGFAKFKEKKNRRGSVTKRRGSVTGTKKNPNAPTGGVLDRNSTASANRQSRRSSVAMSVMNAFNLDMTNRRGRRNSIKGAINAVVHPFKRKPNDLLEDKEYEFFDSKDRKPGEAKAIYSEAKLDELFDVHVLAKARRERDNLGFNLLELSGNRAFYTIHHAFLTKKAVYVLCFNMEKLANKADQETRLEEIKYINYWLKVIRYNSPNASLMVVATHSAEVGKDLYGAVESDISKLVFPELHKAHAKKKQQMQLNKAVEAANEFAKQLEEEAETEGEFVFKKTSLIVNAKDRRLFFPVELSTGKGVENVRLSLDEAAQKQQYYGQKIPVRWLKFLDAMRKDSPNYFCTPSRVEALAFQTLENHQDEMKSALELFHELGYIAHITEIEQIKNTVITDTLSFYRILFRLIFTDEMTLFDMQGAKKKNLEGDIEETLQTGLISQALLDHIWEDELNLVETVGEDEAKKGKKFFLDYAQLTLILAQFKFNGMKDKYVIPSMIPFNHDLCVKTKEDFGDGVDLKCKFKFSGYLTLGVFERLLCLCIQYAGNQPNSLPPILTMGWAQISFGLAYVFRLERLPDDILLQVVETKKKRAYKLVDNFEKMFGRLRDILGPGFMWTTTFESGEDNYIPYKQAKEEKLNGWF